MHHIEDIRINGQKASESPIVISGANTVISWDYVEDIAAPSQLSFEIRIGTSNVHWGLDGFSSSVLLENSLFTGNSYEHVGLPFRRGVTYYAQLRIKDQDNDWTQWEKFSFSVNQLPFVTNFYLSPTNPSTIDNIDVKYKYFDADSHNESGTKIRWFKNNILVSDYNDLCTLPMSATNTDESWSAKIIPCDGIEFGHTVETASVVIKEFDLGFDYVRINPSDANVDDILKVEYQLSDNEYLSLINGTIYIEWYVNDVLVVDSNSQFIRLNLLPNDTVYVKVKLVDNLATLATGTSDTIIISDVIWHIYDLEVSGLFIPVNLVDTSPYIEWKVFKSTANVDDKPDYLRVLITKTPSNDSPIWDTGTVGYTHNSYLVPDTVLKRGQDYYIHVAASDDAIDLNNTDIFVTQKINLAGSSWNESVDNNTGWTIECKLSTTSTNAPPADEGKNIIYPSQGIYIHDGTYFCSIRFYQKYITATSGSSITYNILSSEPDLSIAKTFRISAKNTDIKIYMNNRLIINGIGLLSSPSKLKTIEYGDVDSKYTNEGLWRFFRYTTLSSIDFANNINENTFLFHKIGEITDGKIECIHNNLISWTPEDADESGKIIQYNENGTKIFLSTVSRNFSPITSIFIDKHRNKYIGTANGVTAIYGDKHDPDFEFITDDDDVVITSDKFDRITSVPANKMNLVEPDIKPGWFTIDTTYRSVGEKDPNDTFLTGNPYDPYGFGIKSHAIHYYSQRTHGHKWYDIVDNSKGWQVSFSFVLEKLEQDDFQGFNLDHKGFGVYCNDGEYQEILYFYEDRIRLYYANLFVPIVTTSPRDYRIVGKNNSILIYQKLSAAPTGSYQLLLDGSGLFTTPSYSGGNGRKPKMAFDSAGLYHATWHDDGTGRSQILYSTYDGFEWQSPISITESIQFGLKNPCITTDNQNRVWVAYEDTSWGQSEISVSVKDAAGWNPKIRITNFKSEKHKPFIISDNLDNIHLVWEDNRNGNSQILYAKWSNDRQAWTSSGQYGTDTVVVQQNDNNDPYTSGSSMEFFNPQLSLLSSNLWLICQANYNNSTDDAYGGKQQRSLILKGYLDLIDNQWRTCGAIITNSDGEFIGSGKSSVCSLANRNCINPSVSTNETKGLLIIVWEDQTDPIKQIWGSAYNSSGIEITAPVQITSRTSDCNNPSVGFASNNAIILFDSDGDLYLSYYSGLTLEFFGSNIDNGDTKVLIPSGRKAYNANLAQFVQSSSFNLIYDFRYNKDSSLKSKETPDYFFIGSEAVSHIDVSHRVTQTSFEKTWLVTPLDIKEFAFGDFADNVGMLAHWKDIRMYFGYDSKPLSIAKFNTNTILEWPDNRITDMHVDIFGNLIVSTFGGLAYYNVFTGQITNIEGRTTTYDPSIGCTADTCILKNKVITAVKWGKNGIWYIGSTDGAYFTNSAGKFWEKFKLSDTDNVITIYDIAINKNGEAVLGTSSGVYIVNASTATIQKPDGNSAIFIDIASSVKNADINIRTISVDENDIIWAGSDSGLLRIENRSSFMTFTRNNGMKSNHVTSIAIVNKHLRYIGTANGINVMHGTRFSDIDVTNSDINNNNISTLTWDKDTNSLWIGSLYQVQELIFRDPMHNIISNEIVHYDNTEISTEISFDRKIYRVLDLDSLQYDEINPLDLTINSAKIFINKNLINLGYTVDQTGSAIVFLTNLLEKDMVEIELSNMFIQFHDFNQTAIEEKVIGKKKRSIVKLQTTFNSKQLLAMSDIDKHEILLYAGTSGLPYTSIMLDRDLPIGCIEQIDILSKTTIRFRILAYDALSGISGYSLSNYENFTSDGTTPIELSALPSDGIVTHDISDSINNVFDSLVFPSSVTIDNVSYNVGDGSALGTWTDESGTKFLFAFTSSPSIVFKFNPNTASWSAISILDKNDLNRRVTISKTFNNILFVATETSTPGGFGAVYKTSDGSSFDLVSGGFSSNTSIKAIAGSVSGVIYFGDNKGTILEYKNNVASPKYFNIGSTINSMDIYMNQLIVATGNLGRVYLIDIENDNNIIIFDASESNVNNVHIKDSIALLSPDQTRVYLGISQTSTIYRGNMDTFDFIKSYSSFNNDVNRIITVDTATLQQSIDGEQPLTSTTTIAAIGQSLFKHIVPSWEFFYKHNESILDIAEYISSNKIGLFIISKSKVTKWTNELSAKTVYLRLMDNAGNTSSPPDLSQKCPSVEQTDNPFCCNYAYSINIQDLQDFVNESRIVDISEYGEVIFTYESPTKRSFYSADIIDEEIGIYTSDVFNGSNGLVSWKSIVWAASEPEGTSVNIQIRSGVTETEIEESEWTPNLTPDAKGVVSIEHITDQYIQFRVILKSRIRDVSPSLTSVVLRNFTTQATHFFTTNFVLPSRPVKGILTANTFIPVSADIVFGINTKNTTDFGDYQIIEPNRLFSTEQDQFGKNLRIGAKLLSPGIQQITPTNKPGDPYDASSFVCNIDFAFQNIDNESHNYHFRIRFYNDLFRTQLIHTFFSGNDQTGWKVVGGKNNIFPANGLSIKSLENKSVIFSPSDSIETGQKWYITIEAFNGTSYETISDNVSYVCASCNLKYELGMVTEYYKTGISELTAMPNFGSLTPDLVIIENDIDFPEGTALWKTSSGQELEKFLDHFAIRFKGKLQAPVSGTYSFALQSDDGSILFIDNEVVIDHSVVHTFTSKTGTTFLTDGLHDIEVHYFDATGFHGLQLRWIPPGENSETVVPSTNLFHAVTTEYCDIDNVPSIFNIAVEFSLENSETIKINLT